MDYVTIPSNFFRDAIENMKPGERVIYHSGVLAADRQQGANFAAVNATATAAWEAMEAGQVALLQGVVRRGRGEKTIYDYIAVKLSTPHIHVTWAGPYAPPDKHYTKPKLIAPLPVPGLAAAASRFANIAY